MDEHYGPEWAWDQTRPEAIEARRQVAESLRLFQTNRQAQSNNQAHQERSSSPVAIHFRRVVARLGSGLIFCGRWLYKYSSQPSAPG